MMTIKDFYETLPFIPFGFVKTAYLIIELTSSSLSNIANIFYIRLFVTSDTQYPYSFQILFLSDGSCTSLRPLITPFKFSTYKSISELYSLKMNFYMPFQFTSSLFICQVLYWSHPTFISMLFFNSGFHLKLILNLTKQQ